MVENGQKEVWGLAWFGVWEGGLGWLFFFWLVFKAGPYWVLLSIFSTAALDFESIIKESIFVF